MTSKDLWSQLEDQANPSYDQILEQQRGERLEKFRRGEVEAQQWILPSGSHLYRLFANRPKRHANTFNPGRGKPTRFAFFGDPPVPTLYAAQTDEAAVCETLLHDVPISGGALRPGDYEDKVMGRLLPRRELRLASFMGTGLRTLGVEASNLTGTEADRYRETVLWAAAAHARPEGFDGLVWMSRQCNTDRAYMFFGDRVSEDDLVIDSGFARVFALPADYAWLHRFCAPLNVEVRR
ncbi:RES domain-containing protein [Arthrobacter sp. VKM Ac-2550]|nr:RES domain-containing protein [Arthrobacter sp. VKM Ac-2550]